MEPRNLTLLRMAAVVALAWVEARPSVGAESDSRATFSERPGQYRVSERGPHHRVWQGVVPVSTNQLGQIAYRTNRFTELKTGLHRLLASAGRHRLAGPQWVESSSEIVMVPGGAAATNTAHQIFLAANANCVDALRLRTPEGTTLTSHVLFLSYFSPATGSNVVIAELQDSLGQILPSHDEVIYTNALAGEGCAADVLYRNSCAGLEQNILLHRRLPPPSAYGLGGADDSIILQVWSEFTHAPAPRIIPRTVAMESPAAAASGRRSIFKDCLLDFGLMKIGMGKAFSFGPQAEASPAVRVLKEWLTIRGRKFLVEQVPLRAIAAQLLALPAQAAAGRLGLPAYAALRTGSPALVPPPTRLAQPGIGRMTLARLDLSNERAFCLDYSLLQGQAAFTLQSDTTYLVSGLVNIGQLTVEGGTVIKYAGSPLATIVSTNVVCKTSPYGMAIFTGGDDPTVGEPVSTNAVTSNYYGGTALDLSAADSGIVLSNLHFRYLNNAVAGTGITLRHGQIVQCSNAFAAGSRHPTLYNTLLYRLNSAVDQTASTGDTFTAEHLTAHYCTNFLPDTSGTINLTNCLFACVTNWQCAQTFTGSSIFLDSDSGVFQTCAAGSHYLAPFSPLRGAGTTGIDSALLAELALKTTWPPIPLTNTIGWSTNLGPHIQRGQPRPDIGYYYSAIDYMASNSLVTNSTLTITPGTVIAYCDCPGLWLQDRAQIRCIGAPTDMIRFADYRAVQETPIKLGNYYGNSSGIGVYTYRYQGVGSPGEFRFTAFSRMAGGSQGWDVYVNFPSWSYSSLSVRDCSFLGGGWLIAADGEFSLSVINNVFERVNMDTRGPFSWAVYNNLFKGGMVSFQPATGALWTVRDNVFDSGEVEDVLGDVDVVEDHNAFVNAQAHLVSTNSSDLLLNTLDYATGPLGSYYQRSTTLVDRGSRSSPAAGLYHYTTQIDNLKEGLSQVDIGPHYVALGQDGLPLDTDGGGAPDYLENAAGDGNNNNSNETNWQDAADDYKYLLVPGYLRCEYRVDPWGVDARDPVSGAQRPRFYWTVSSPQRGQKQAAYQLQVATDPGILTNNLADVWDSGKVYSDRTIQVEYESKAGRALQSGQRLWWRVRSWDLDSGLPTWSTNGFLQMGLIGPNDWNGVNWIGVSGYRAGQPCPIYRKEFVLTNRVQNATAYVSAKGVYELWVNGQKVGPNLLAPEWTDYHKRIQYQTFDLGGGLNSGTNSSTNVIGAVVGEGWFSGSGEVGNGACANMGAPNAQFALRLTITNADLSATQLVTDATWAAYTNGAVRSSSIIRGEVVDATQEGFYPDWASVAYTNSSLFQSSYLTNYSVTASQMVAQPSYPIQATQTNPAVAVWTISQNETAVVKVYDVGQLVSGVCRLTVHTGATNANEQIKLDHAEVLQLGQPNNSAPNGPSQADIYTANLNGINQEETFVLNGNAVQTFQPHFTYHAFRFVRVTAPASLAADLTTSSLCAIVTRSALPTTGAFVCYDTNSADNSASGLLANNPVSRLMTNISWTIRNNLQGVFTSCGGRNERNGYFYDEHIVSQTACFDVDIATFLTKIGFDIRDAQQSSGQYSIYAPNAGQYWPPQFADPGNEAGGLILPWRLYQNYGDTRIVAQHYASASNWVAYATDRFKDHIWHAYEVYAPGGTGTYSQFQVGDWMHAGAFNGHPAGWYPGTNVSGLEGTNWGTAWYAFSADTLASMSQVLQEDAAAKGDSARAQSYADQRGYYASLAAEVRSAYTNLAADPNRWIRYDTNNHLTTLFYNTQADCVMALAFNMVPDNQRSNVWYILLRGPQGIENFNRYYGTSWDLSTGYYCSPRAMIELTRAGFTELAYRVLTDATFPCWLYQPAYGFTTCSENWNTYIFGAGSDRGYFAQVSPSLSSCNHLPFAAVGEWIWEVVAGINLDDAQPGFGNVIIRPQPGGGITNAFASFQSIHGPIITCWTNDPVSKSFSLNVTIPANITASVHLVGAVDLGSITEGSNYATNTPGLLAAPLVTNGAALFQLGSGSYKFKTPIRTLTGKFRRKDT